MIEMKKVGFFILAVLMGLATISGATAIIFANNQNYKSIYYNGTGLGLINNVFSVINPNQWSNTSNVIYTLPNNVGIGNNYTNSRLGIQQSEFYYNQTNTTWTVNNVSQFGTWGVNTWRVVNDGKKTGSLFYVDSTLPGDWIMLDTNSSKAFGTLYVSSTGAIKGDWMVQGSNDLSTWTNGTLANFTRTCSKDVQWTYPFSWSNIGSYRYWRLLKTSNPAGGQYVNELQFTEEYNNTPLLSALTSDDTGFRVDNTGAVQFIYQNSTLNTFGPDTLDSNNFKIGQASLTTNTTFKMDREGRVMIGLNDIHVTPTLYTAWFTIASKGTSVLGQRANMTMYFPTGGGSTDYAQIGSGYSTNGYADSVIAFPASDTSGMMRHDIVFATANTTTSSPPTIRLRIDNKNINITESQLNIKSKYFIGTGNVTSNGSSQLTGIGTLFLSEVQPGDYLSIDLAGSISNRMVSSVTSNTLLTMDNTLTTIVNKTFGVNKALLYGNNNAGTISHIAGNGNIGIGRYAGFSTGLTMQKSSTTTEEIMRCYNTMSTGGCIITMIGNDTTPIFLTIQQNGITRGSIGSPVDGISQNGLGWIQAGDNLMINTNGNQKDIYFGVGNGYPAMTIDGTTATKGFVCMGNCTTPKNQLSVHGSASIGSTYADINTAPVDGLIVQGPLAVGTTTTTGKAEFYNSAGRYARIETTGGITSQYNDDAMRLGTYYINTQNGAGYGTGFGFQLGYNGTTSNTGVAVSSGYIASIAETNWSSTGSTRNAKMVFATTSAGNQLERMSIRSDGNVCIGCANASVKLAVNGSINSDTNANSESVFRMRNINEGVNAFTSMKLENDATGDGHFSMYMRGVNNTGEPFGTDAAVLTTGDGVSGGLRVIVRGGATSDFKLFTKVSSTYFERLTVHNNGAIDLNGPTTINSSSLVVLGAEQVVNGNFSLGDVNWTHGTNWTITTGKANYTGSNPAADPLMGQFYTTNGLYYKVEIDIINTNGYIDINTAPAITELSGARLFQNYNGVINREITSFKANRTGWTNITFTPTATTGIYSFSVRPISTMSTSSFTVLDNSSVASIEMRGGEAGKGNLLIGPLSGQRIVGGAQNVLIGNNVGSQIMTGSENTCIGRNTCAEVISSSGSVSIGSLSGDAVTSGSSNALVGYAAGSNINSGSYNTCMGMQSCLGTTVGAYNTAIGMYSLQTMAGSSNTVVGAYASGGTSSTGNQNTWLGAYSGRLNNGTGNVFLGYGAGSLYTGSNAFIVDNQLFGTSPYMYGDMTNHRLALGGLNRTVNTLDVSGGVAIGSLYAGVNTAPVDGLIVSGNTGLGTPNPQSALHLNFADPSIIFQRSDSSTPSGALTFEGTSGGSPTYGTSLGWYQGTILFKTDSTPTDTNNNLTERMRIDSNGYIGIGTKTPEMNLDVNGSTIIRGNITINNLVGVGNAYACLNENGTLYRSNVTCI